jgi:hypothetical protein
MSSIELNPSSRGTAVNEQIIINAYHAATQKAKKIGTPVVGHPMVEIPVKSIDSVSIASVTDIPPIWTTNVDNHIITYIHKDNEYYKLDAIGTTSPINASLHAEKTPVDRATTIPDVKAILWFDETLIWWIDTSNHAKCYIFVDSVYQKPSMWPRNDKINDESYKQVKIPTELFHTPEMVQLASMGVKPIDVLPTIRYSDKGKHTLRTFWVKMWRETPNGYNHCRVSLIVIEQPQDSMCPNMSPMEPLTHVIDPYKIQTSDCIDPAILSPIELVNPTTHKDIFGIL